ncbi:MAG: SOS response-associated peptidase family protein [Marinobacter sp.]|nr:SOS response-associated peptidase family protein [Marinobacter sp.]
MCGRYNIIDSPEIRDLMEQLGLPLFPETWLDIAPGGRGQIVYDGGRGRTLVDAVWSLLIEPHPNGQGYRPSPRYSTFNARAGSLEQSPLWRKRVHRQRAIIPASGFHEWTGPKGHKQCHYIAPVGSAIAFAGLYELWDFDGDCVPAFTIITLPPHPRFSHIHSKSLPLMLRPGDFDAWLDPGLTSLDPFRSLFEPRIRTPLRVTPVRSPRDLANVGEEEIIDAD